MVSCRVRRVSRFAVSPSLFLALFSVAACSGGGPTGPPPPPPTDAALRIELEFDAAAQGLEPAGFRFQDLSRIEIVVEGGIQGRQTILLAPPQEAAFLPVRAGSYTLSATGFYGTDLVLFAATLQAVTVAKGDTASVALSMQATLGEVSLEIDGKRDGVIGAVAGENVPFVVTVLNAQSRPVPNAVIAATSTSGFGDVLLEGTNLTDAEGRVQGIIRAPYSGVIDGFRLTVDGRTISTPPGLRVEFASAVDAAHSDVSDVSKANVIADGRDASEFTLFVHDAEGEPLAGIPVTATSSRNLGLDTRVDQFVALPGYEAGKTDAAGRFRFAVRSTTSSFIKLDEQGRLYSPPDAGRVFFPATILIFADGVQIDQRDLVFISVVYPTGSTLSSGPNFVPADGQSSALIVVNVRELPQFGGEPAAGVFVEITNTHNESMNYLLDIRPEPGFDGFRTNASGQWRGRLRSNQARTISFEAKADGRALTVTPRSVVFQ